MKKSTKFAMRAVPLVITLAIAGQAYAQEKLDEVVVSAQKRTQRIQDVPMSISAISGQALEDRKIEGAADLQGSVPNLNVVAAPVSGLIAAATMRGIGTAQPSIWMDPGVGMYVDGVFVGKNQGALFDMLDLERVEALRGPQGTLFGRNTLGGAVNFVTRKPSGQFSGNVGLEVGNYGRSVQKISIDTPRTQEGLSLTLASRNEKQDGWLDNGLAGAEKWGNRNRESFKLNALFDVSKDTKLNYAFDRSDINETTTPMSLTSASGYCSVQCQQLAGAFSQGYYGAGGFVYNPAASLAAAISPYVQTGLPTSTTSTLIPIQGLKVNGHAWGFETAVNANAKLKYTGSHRTMAYNDQGDYDGTPVNVFSGIRSTDYTTDSHELQLTGTAPKINYVAGLYYFKDSGYTEQQQIGGFFSFNPNPLAVMKGLSNFRLGTVASAAYGQVDYAVDKDTTLTGGLRYTTEEKTGSVERNVRANIAAPMNPISTTASAEATFSAWTPSVSLSHKLNANQMVFGRLAKGFKSGGFPLEAATAPLATTPFKPENSTSYEAGFKGANGNASYAATVFLTKLKDQQISYLPQGSTTPTVTNAGASTYSGIELEGAFKVTKDTKIQGGYGYLNAKFDEFLAPAAVGGAIIDGASNLVVGYAPKHTLNLGLESNLGNTSFGRLKGLIDYRYVSSYSNYAANISLTAPNAIVGNSAAASKMAALGTVNARLILDQVQVGGPGQMDISLWAKNLTNKQTIQNMMDVSGFYQVGYWSNPRTVGLTANYKW